MDRLLGMDAPLRSGHAYDPNHSTDRQHQQNNVYYLQSLLLSLLQRNQVPLHAAVEEDSAQLILIPAQCVEHTAWDESRCSKSINLLQPTICMSSSYESGKLGVVLGIDHQSRQKISFPTQEYHPRQ
mmetsp:Transcript_47047/g.54327  ORF Transcript_47047/g.54327 Transcript_47047/m.54327 type:complete len:127 (+) Transcript_47047:298-678(+)